MLNKVLIVDLNNIWNKYLFGRRGDFSNTIGSVLVLFKSIYQAGEFSRIVFVVDGTPTERYEEFKDYKANRGHKPDKYIPMKTLMSVINQYCRVFEGKDVEGDDIIAFIAKNLSEKYDVYIYSNDKDFIQLMQYGIKIVTSFNRGRINEVLTEEAALNKFKNSKGESLQGINNVLKYRVFKGDSSDNIPSACKGMLDKDIRNIVYNCWIEETLDEDILMSVIGRCSNPKITQALIDNKSNIIRNYKLMNLWSFPENFKEHILKSNYNLDLTALEEYLKDSRYDLDYFYKWK